MGGHFPSNSLIKPTETPDEIPAFRDSYRQNLCWGLGSLCASRFGQETLVGFGNRPTFGQFSLLSDQHPLLGADWTRRR
jgi:hypothetical protein